MQISEIILFLKQNFSGLKTKESYGETTLFYNPNNKLKNGVYFVTFKENDGPNDKASNLDRKDIFRMSFKPNPKSYEKIFGEKPKRPKKGQVVDLDYDFSKLNTLLPHPIYAWMGWVNILNPDEKFFKEDRSLLEEAYKLVKEKFEKKVTN